MEVLLFNLSLNLPSLVLYLATWGTKDFVNKFLADNGTSVSPCACLTANARRFDSKAHFDIDFSLNSNVLADSR
jgi:hypothetical protein